MWHDPASNCGGRRAMRIARLRAVSLCACCIATAFVIGGLVGCAESNGAQDLGDGSPAVKNIPAPLRPPPRQPQKRPARHRGALVEIRKEFHESDNPTTRAEAAEQMGLLYDYKSMDALLDGMEDASPEVRAASNAAVVRMIGLDGHFDENGPADDRDRIRRFFKLQWDHMRDSKILQEFEAKLTRHFGELPD